MATAAVLAVAAIGTAVQVTASKGNQRVAENISAFNRRLAVRDAELALESGRKKAEDVRENTRKIISSNRAAFGASNLVTTSGSPLLVQLRQAEEGEETAQDVLLQSRLQAAGFSAQASLDEFQQRIIGRRARSERTGAILNGVSRGLSTAGSLRSN
jgi:hypothetical protein